VALYHKRTCPKLLATDERDWLCSAFAGDILPMLVRRAIKEPAHKWPRRMNRAEPGFVVEKHARTARPIEEPSNLLLNTGHVIVDRRCPLFDQRLALRIPHAHLDNVGLAASSASTLVENGSALLNAYFAVIWIMQAVFVELVLVDAHAFQV